MDSMIAPARPGAEGHASSAVPPPANSASPAPLDWTSARLTVWSLAIALLVLHLATNALYGFHRDELYYLDSARHLAWGFVDYPPVTPAIARLSQILFGSSVWGLRLWPSVAGAAMVVLTAQIARELGGGRTAVILSAVGGRSQPGAAWLQLAVRDRDLRSTRVAGDLLARSATPENGRSTALARTRHRRGRRFGDQVHDRRVARRAHFRHCDDPTAQGSENVLALAWPDDRRVDLLSQRCLAGGARMAVSHIHRDPPLSPIH